MSGKIKSVLFIADKNNITRHFTMKCLSLHLYLIVNIIGHCFKYIDLVTLKNPPTMKAVDL